RRKIRAGKKRLLSRRQKHRHRPTTLTVIHRDRGGHVDLIEIRSFFPVYLNTDKPSVHEFCNGLVFKGLPFHHMAPVASGIADREQDGAIFFIGKLQGFRSPGIPVYGVVGMLQQIRAGFVNKTIGTAVILRSIHGFWTVSSMKGEGQLKKGTWRNRRCRKMLSTAE